MSLSINEIKEELKNKGEIVFVPSGNSMWPTLKDRAQRVVVQAKTARLNKYDVALFEKNGVLVLHRVVKVTENGYITCGDSQVKTESVPEDAVLGVMKGFYQGEKFIDASDEKYDKKIKRWYKHKALRKFKIKCFYLLLRIKNRLKKIKKGK